MVQPTPEQYAVLRPSERVAYRMGDFFSRRMPWLSAVMNTIWMKWLVWFFGGRRFVVHGQENLAHLERHHRVLLVANHRSFYDFFVIMCTLWFNSRAPTRIVMPVRATYYYDHFTGPLVNLLMSGFSMFPPVLRDERGKVFNKFTADRMVAEMGRPGTVMGMHPEGTRNKGPDPYDFLSPRPGTGRIIYECPEVIVVPVFVLGMSNNGWREWLWNWSEPSQHPIDVVYGPPLDLSDLRVLADDADTHLAISARCMDAISALAKWQRELRQGTARQAV